MNTPECVSPSMQKDKGEWPTPIRAIIRGLQRQGKSQREIVRETGIHRHTIRRILKQESSHRDRKKTYSRPHMIGIRTICQVIWHISRNWLTRILSFEAVWGQLGIKASAHTIWRELCCTGYQRCISCPRPFITCAQAKKRLAFAYKH